MSAVKELISVWKTVIILILPIITLPVLFIDGSNEMACLYGVIIVAVLWVTEALPLPVTSLCPVILFSVLGVLPAKEIAASYVKDASIFSLSCLIFALCVEKWNLHRRIALRIMLIMGSSPKWLILGFMLPTWFLSMWVNNTSATAMMIPVVMAVLQELRRIQTKTMADQTVQLSEKAEIPEAHLLQQNLPAMTLKKGSDEPSEYHSEEFRSLCKSLSICVCFAASIGGTGSLTGTSTNVIIQGQAEEIFGLYGLDSDLNFLSWLICCLPISAICLLIAWAWLLVHFFGLRELLTWSCGDVEETNSTRRVIQKSLNELGPLSFAEKAIIGHFLLLISLWLSMKLPGGVGWYLCFPNGFVNNSTPAVVIVASLFIFPSQTRNSRQMKTSKETLHSGSSESKRAPPLLDWKTVQLTFPWGTFCLINGGYAIANLCQKSGLSQWLGMRLSGLSSVQPWVMLLVLTLTISFLTEFMSNAATASILGPILAELALTLGMNPLYLMLPGALSCSMAFMLPVATPPNTIVFATGHIKAVDLAKAGILLNILCVLVVNIGVNVWMTPYFQLKVLPPGMNRTL